jgi:hypothetical protein
MDNVQNHDCYTIQRSSLPSKLEVSSAKYVATSLISSPFPYLEVKLQ